MSTREAQQRSPVPVSMSEQMREYDLIADWYATERTDATGVPEVQELAASIAPGSRILDIGCGNGIPLTRALLGSGHRVVGLDSSGRMLEHFRRNWPVTPAVRALVQACPFLPGTFDAAVAWGVMFHLPQQEEGGRVSVSSPQARCTVSLHLR